MDTLAERWATKVCRKVWDCDCRLQESLEACVEWEREAFLGNANDQAIETRAACLDERLAALEKLDCGHVELAPFDWDLAACPVFVLDDGGSCRKHLRGLSNCPDGWCDVQGETQESIGSCVPAPVLPGEGDACTYDRNEGGVCAPGLVCDSASTCSDGPDLGAACPVMDGDVVVGCNGSWCGPDGVCEPFRQIGEGCDSGEQCEFGCVENECADAPRLLCDASLLLSF